MEQAGCTVLQRDMTATEREARNVFEKIRLIQFDACNVGCKVICSDVLTGRNHVFLYSSADVASMYLGNPICSAQYEILYFHNLFGVQATWLHGWR